MSIKINSIDKEFVYIDPSLRSESGTEGDGSTPQNALWDFPSTVSENSLYLIRKTSRHVVAKLKVQITDSTCTSLTIWGMPGPTEKHWNDVPEVARTAWGGDTQEGYKAALLVPGKDGRYDDQKQFNLSGLKYLNLSNLRFLDSSGYDSSSSSEYCIYSSSNACDMVIEDVNFAGVRETTTNSETQYLQYHEFSDTTGSNTGRKWIYVNDASSSSTTQATANSCIINNCTFDYVSGKGEGIHIGYCRNTCITNVTVNLYAMYNSSISTVNCLTVSGRTDTYRTNSRVIVRGFTGRLYCNAKSTNPTYHYFTSLLRINSSIVDMKDVDISFANPQYGQISTSTDQTISFSSSLINMSQIYAGSRVESFTADFSNYLDLANTQVLYITYYKHAGYPRNGQHLVVKDVTITSNASPIVTTLGDHNSQLETTGLSEKSTPYAALCIYGSTDGYTNASDDVLLQNVNINAYKGIALMAQGSTLDLSESDIKGLVWLTRCTGKIKSISTFAIQAALADDGGNLVHIGEISCNKDSASYSGQPAITLKDKTRTSDNSSYILVTTSNTNCYSTDALNDAKACCLICTNNSATGNYTCRNKTTTCQTWSSFRTGAQHKCSLKLESKNYNQAEMPLIIGDAPFKGIVKHVDQGAHKIKLYANTIGYSSITASEFGQHLSVIARLPNGEMLSDVQGSWSADTTSEWNNLDGGTAFVLEIPIAVTDASGVDLEFQYTFNWYHIQGATYLDPYPVIE